MTRGLKRFCQTCYLMISIHLIFLVDYSAPSSCPGRQNGLSTFTIQNFRVINTFVTKIPKKNGVHSNCSWRFIVQLPKEKRPLQACLAQVRSGKRGDVYFHAYGQDFKELLKERVKLQPKGSLLYTGYLPSDPHSWIFGSINKGGFVGQIYTQNKLFYIEKSSKYIEKSRLAQVLKFWTDEAISLTNVIYEEKNLKEVCSPSRKQKRHAHRKHRKKEEEYDDDENEDGYEDDQDYGRYDTKKILQKLPLRHSQRRTQAPESGDKHRTYPQLPNEPNPQQPFHHSHPSHTQAPVEETILTTTTTTPMPARDFVDNFPQYSNDRYDNENADDEEFAKRSNNMENEQIQQPTPLNSPTEETDNFNYNNPSDLGDNPIPLDTTLGTTDSDSTESSSPPIQMEPEITEISSSENSAIFDTVPEIPVEENYNKILPPPEPEFPPAPPPEEEDSYGNFEQQGNDYQNYREKTTTTTVENTENPPAPNVQVEEILTTRSQDLFVPEDRMEGDSQKISVISNSLSWDYKNSMLNREITFGVVTDHTFYQMMGEGSIVITIARLVYFLDRVEWIFRSTDWDESGLPDNLGLSVKNIAIELSKGKSYNTKRLESVASVVKSFGMMTLGFSASVSSKAVTVTSTYVGSNPDNLLAFAVVTTVDGEGRLLPDIVIIQRILKALLWAIGLADSRRTFSLDCDSSTERTGADSFLFRSLDVSDCYRKSIQPILFNFTAESENMVAFCGNGILEPGEECDCGRLEECGKFNVSCCHPRGNVLRQCRFALESNCYDPLGICCDIQTCAIADFLDEDLSCNAKLCGKDESSAQKYPREYHQVINGGRKSCGALVSSEPFIQQVPTVCFKNRCQSKECSRLELFECTCLPPNSRHYCSTCCYHPEIGCVASDKAAEFIINNIRTSFYQWKSKDGDTFNEFLTNVPNNSPTNVWKLLASPHENKNSTEFTDHKLFTKEYCIDMNNCINLHFIHWQPFGPCVIHGVVSYCASNYICQPNYQILGGAEENSQDRPSIPIIHNVTDTARDSSATQIVPSPFIIIVLNHLFTF